MSYELNPEIIKYLLNNVAEGIIVVDENSNTVFCNEGAAALRNVNAKDIIGKSVLECHRPKSRQAVAVVIEKFKDGTMKQHRRTISFNENYYENSYTPIFNDDGKYLGVIIISRDITKQKTAENKLQEQNLELIKLQKVKEDLSHMIVHDLNNPLTSIQGYIELVCSDEVGDECKDDLTIAFNECQRLKTMITNILDVHKLEDSRVKLNKTVFDIKEIVEPTIVSTKGIAHTKQISLVHSIDEKLSKLSADNNLLRRVLENLVSNALRVTPSGGKVEIKVTPDADNHSALFCVSDTGPGIAKEYHTQIFEKYVQTGEEKKRRPENRGFGLTFCKMAVAAHHGQIWVAITPGNGSQFMFLVPSL